MFAVDRSTTATVADAAANDDFAVRQRLDSFKLGKVMPPSLSNGAPGGPPGHKHRRSHSRNASVSSSSSMTASLASSRSSGLNDLSTFSFGSLSSSPSASTLSSSGSVPSSMSNSGSAPSSKRNSHHRRRSSVSTRRESAELMGVSLPDMPPASLEDNVNFGEKDSIRRRALLALEGKHTVSFSKVEIPELTTPEVEKMMFDFSTKPSLAGGLSTGFGNSLLGGKRDSFKLLSSSGSSKDQLHTLLEEEEEDEEESAPQGEKYPQDSLPSPTTSSEDHFSLPAVSAPAVAVTKPTPVRPRPATLNLRPLSLTPDNLGATGLPTPSLTPSPRSGLRSLSLNPTVPPCEESIPEKRGTVSRRPVLNLSMESKSETPSHTDENKPVRRSSISYRSSSQSSIPGLPTPEMTPVLSRRCSVSESIRSSKSGDDEFFPAHPSYRPLSVSEQHFLYKSHNALLARITDLEKALSTRRMSMGGYSINGGSRPSSVLSDCSFPGEVASPAEEPSDEMLVLIRDLKAERDELKKDVDGWRTRVADLDKQLVLVAKRVENERREAWVARSRVGLLEAEKLAIEKRMEALDKVMAELEGEKAELQAENAMLKEQAAADANRIRDLEAELEAIKQELESERAKNSRHHAASEENFDTEFVATPTPQSVGGQDRWNQGLGFGMDASDDCAFNFGFSTTGQADDSAAYSDDEDCLAEYENEEDGDSEIETSSSFGSLPDYPQRTPIQVFTPAPPSHRSRGSLSNAWTFPQVKEGQTHKPRESVDKFFGCLDESDTSDECGPITPVTFDYEESKGLFASGFKYADDNDAPFYLPGGVGTVVEEAEVKSDRKLSAVAEEEEDEEDDRLSEVDEEDNVLEEAGGITFIFTPPEEVEEQIEAEQLQLATPVKPVSTPPTLPALDFGHDDEEEEGTMLDFAFGRNKATKESTPSETFAPPPSSAPEKPAPSMITPPSSIPRSSSRAASPPSSIPRPAFRPTPPSPSPRVAQSTFATPPSKRGGGVPSFIPQPVSSPSPSRTLPSRPKTTVPAPTFIRQPARSSPLTPLSPSKPHTANIRNGSAFQPLNSIMHPLTITPKSQPRNRVVSGITRPQKRT